MSIFNWFNKMLGIDSSNINNNLPSEFQLPTDDESIGDRMHNFEYMQETTNSLQENIDDIQLNLHNFLRQLDFEFSNMEEVYVNTFNEYNSKYNNTFDKSSNIEGYNSVPKKNFIARNYFLKPSHVPRILNELPISVTTFPGPNFGQSISRSYITGNWNGKMIEKEISTKRLQDGNIEKVIVMKDGNQKCITTITENSKTKEQNYTKQLINLDKSQLEEFENRFSKLR